MLGPRAAQLVVLVAALPSPNPWDLASDAASSTLIFISYFFGRRLALRKPFSGSSCTPGWIYTVSLSLSPQIFTTFLGRLAALPFIAIFTLLTAQTVGSMVRTFRCRFQLPRCTPIKTIPVGLESSLAPPLNLCPRHQARFRHLSLLTPPSLARASNAHILRARTHGPNLRLYHRTPSELGENP